MRDALKSALSKAVIIKKILIWSIVAFCCLTAIGVFVKRFVEDTAAGKEIFYPGVLLLTLAVIAVFFFSVRMVWKYVVQLQNR